MKFTMKVVNRPVLHMMKWLLCDGLINTRTLDFSGCKLIKTHNNFFNTVSMLFGSACILIYLTLNLLTAVNKQQSSDPARGSSLLTSTASEIPTGIHFSQRQVNSNCDDHDSHFTALLHNSFST